MKQYYESEVLFQLMERDGFNIPSSVPPYEAEIKAYLINQVKQAYPKLTDYEAEWLLYNYTKHLPADFPISSVSNVTEASFENVVPFAYQSAILKGQTLVNLNKVTVKDSSYQTFNNSWQTITTSENSYNLWETGDVSLFKTNTKYLLIIDVNQNTLSYDIDMIVGHPTCVFPLSETKRKTNYKSGEVGRKVLTLTTNNNFDGVRCVQRFATSMDVSVPNETITYRMMFIEYQNGMENWDIPYFEGMKSVQMPVLTTTGKNLFYVTKSNGYYSYSNGNWVNDERFKTLSARVLPNTIYTQNIMKNNITFWNNGIFVSGIVNSPTFTTPTNCNEVRVSCSMSLETYMLEMGDISTSYEPFKSNILTVNEPVELRGIGEVKDELNLLTGELTQRIGEIVLDGSDDENWKISNNSVGEIVFNGSVPNIAKAPANTVSVMKCDKIPVVSIADTWGGGTTLGISQSSNGNYIQLKLDSTTLPNQTIEGLMTYLRNNPLTLQYQFETPTIKTVELTTVNDKGETTYFMPLEGTMNVQSSGEIIEPTFDMSVPVEAITQNLASFIELEMGNNHE